MTAPQDQSVDISNGNQEAVTTAIRTWSDAVQSFASGTTAGQSRLPNLSSVVDQYFGFAEKLLANQRLVAQHWTSTTATASRAVTEQAQRATQPASADTTNVTEAVVDDAAEAVPVADHTAAGITRPTDTAADS
jgi:hypothetical protein